MPSVQHSVRNFLKNTYLQAMGSYRQTTWRKRSLPSFIIIGAQKSGTTSLYRYLCQHPQLFPAFYKEVHFFDGGLQEHQDNYQKGVSWYRSNFPTNTQLGSSGKTFEASPLYLFNPLVPDRMCNLLPQVKLIAVLRNPTERAISQYFHEKRNKNEDLPILEALQSEEERLAPALEQKDYKNKSFIHHSYKSRGLYKNQLERYFKRFPEEQLFIINSEQFFSEPGRTLRDVFSFLEVDPGFEVKDLQPRNVANNKRQVDPAVYTYLERYFVPHNQALYELINENYNW